MLDEWIDNITHKQPMTIDGSTSVEGIFDKHLGPRWNYARIEVIAEPADRLEVSVEVAVGEMPPQNWIREAIFGMLDVLVTQMDLPVLNLRLRIVGATTDHVRSTQHSFRLAGRAAARELLGAVRVSVHPG